MSDISNQNAERMIAETKRMQALVSDLRGELDRVNQKVSTLTLEVADLKKAQIMATVQAQMADKGHGGTG